MPEIKSNQSQNNTKVNTDLSKVTPALTDDQVLNKLSVHLDPVFKPLTDSNVSKKSVYFNGKLSNMPYYSNQKDGYDYAYDKESNKILKYTGKEWEDVGAPKQFDSQFYNKRQEVVNGDFSAKKMEESTKGFDPNNPFISSQYFNVNPLAKNYLEAPKKTIKKIDTEIGTLDAETYTVNGQEYALDKNTKAIYKKGVTKKEIDVEAKPSIKYTEFPNLWEKVKDLSDRDLQIAAGGIGAKTGNGTTTQLLSKVSGWYGQNIVNNVTPENADEKSKEAKAKVISLYNSRDKQTVYNAGKNLPDAKQTEFFNDPINLIKVLGLDKGIDQAKNPKDAKALQDNVNDLVEYLELLKSNGDLRQFKYTDPFDNNQPKTQFTYNQLVVEAKKTLNSSPSPIIEGFKAAVDLSFFDTPSPTIPIREGLKDYQQEKYRISINNMRLANKDAIVKTAQTFEKYAPALKLTEDLKKQYEKAVVEKDSVKVAKLSEILNKRGQELAKVLPSESDNKAFNDYLNTIQDAYSVYNSVDANLKHSYPHVYNKLEKDRVAQIELQKFNKAHPALGFVGQLTSNTLAGMTGTVLGISSTMAREFSNGSTYDSLDVIADYLDKISDQYHENVTDKSVKSLSWIGAAQSAGYSIGLMVPSILASVALPEAEGVIAGNLARKLTTGTIQFASVFTGIYADYYRKGIEQGLSEKEATKYANISAAANSALELFIPVDKVVKSTRTLKFLDISVEDFVKVGLHNGGNLRVQGLKNLLGSQLESFVGENFEEYTQNLADMLIQKNYNGEKLTNFEVSDPNADILGTAVSVGLTNILMGGLGVSHMSKHWSQKNSEKTAYEHLSRNFDDYLAYSNKLLSAGTITPTEYKEQYDKVANTHTLLGLNNPASFFNNVKKLESNGSITKEQALDLKLNYSKYISTINSFTKEEKVAFNKLDGLKEKADYVNEIAYKEYTPEKVAEMTNQIYFEDVLRDVQKFHADLEASNDPKDVVTNSLLLRDVLTNNRIGIEALLGFNIVDDKTKGFKTKEVIEKTNAYLAAQTELKAKDIKIDTTELAPEAPIVETPPVEKPTTLVDNIKTLFPEKDSLDNFIDNHTVKELNEKFKLDPEDKDYEKNKAEVLQALEEYQASFTAPKQEAPKQETKPEVPVKEELSNEDLSEDEIFQLEFGQSQENKEPIKEEVQETPKQEKDEYEYYQRIHLPGNGGRMSVIGKNKRTGTYVKLLVNPKTKQVDHIALSASETKAVIEKGLVPHKNAYEKLVSDHKDKLLARSFLAKGLGLFSTNYRTNKNSEEGAKEQEELKAFLASATEEQVKNAITIYSDNKVSEMNEEFLGRDPENPSLPIEDLIEYGFIFVSDGKMEHLNKGGKIAAIRRNTFKDVYFKIALPSGKEIIQEVDFPDRYIILEKVDGKLKAKKLDFSTLSLEEFKSMFASFDDKVVLTQEDLDLQIQKDLTSKKLYTLASTTPIVLAKAPNIKISLSSSSIANRNFDEAPLLAPAIKSHSTIFNNLKKGIVVVFNDWKNALTVASKNQAIKADITTPYSTGYFIQVYNEKTDSYSFIKVYLNTISEETKTKFKTIIDSYNLAKPENIEDATTLAKNIVDELNNLIFIQSGDDTRVYFDSKISKGSKQFKPTLQIISSKKITTGEKVFYKENRIDVSSDISTVAKILGVTEESFKEQLPKPSDMGAMSDEELSKKFNLSTAPYVWEATASLSLDTTVVDTIAPILPSTPPTLSTQNEFGIDEEQESDQLFDDEGGINEYAYNQGVSGIQEYDLEGNVLNQSNQDKPDNSTTNSKDIPLQNGKESKPIAELKEDKTPERLDVEKEIEAKKAELQVETDFVKQATLEAAIELLEDKLKKKDTTRKTLKLDDGKVSTKLTKEELQTIREELPAGVKIRFQNALDRLESGELPLGYLLSNTIFLSRNSKKGTAYHEQFHAVFRLLLSDEEITKYLNMAKANAIAQNKDYFSVKNISDFITKRGYDISSSEAIDLMAEEWMADDYMDHREKKSKQSKYSLKSLYDILRSFYTAIVGNKKLSDLYNNIGNKGYSNSTFKNNRFNNISTPIYSILEGYRGVIGGNLKSERIISLITAKTIESLDKARMREEPTESSLFRKNTIKNLLNTLLKTEQEQTSLIIKNNETATEKLTEEDLAQLKNELKQLTKVLSGEEDVNTIISEVGAELNKIQYIEGEDEMYEQIENELGARSYDKTGDEVDTGYGKLSIELKNFFKSIYYKDVDNYGRQIERVVNGYKMYNFMLNIVSNVGLNNVLSQLENIAVDNIEVRALINAFKQKTNWSAETAHLFNDYSDSSIKEGAITNLKGFSFYNRFITAIDRVKLEHKTTIIDRGKNTTRIISSNRDTPEKFLYNDWESNFRASTFTTINKKKIALELAQISNSALYNPEEVGQEVVVENLYKAQKTLASIGISLTYSYLDYSLARPDENIADVPKIDKEFFSNIRASFLNDALFVEDSIDNKDITSTNRIKEAAKGNTYFDNNVYQTSFKTADGKTRYSYVLPNYIATKSKELKNKFGIFQLLGKNDSLNADSQKKIEEIKSYKDNAYFKNNPLFSLFSEETIGKNFSNFVATNDGDIKHIEADKKADSGRVYKDGDIKSLLVVLLSGFSKFDNTKKNGGVNIFKGWTQQMESASTLYTIGLPVVKNLYSVKGGWSDQAIATLYGMFEQEVDRINGKFYIDSKNNVFTEPGPGLRNLKEVCKNPLFANFKFLNKFEYKVGNKTEKLIHKSKDEEGNDRFSVNEITPDTKLQILAEIKSYFNSELATFINTLKETNIVEEDKKGKLTSDLIRIKDSEAEYRNFDSLNDLVGSFFINDFLMSAGFNQLMYGDLAISKNDSDASKRYKGVNAYGPSYSGMKINVAHTTETKITHPEFGEINVNDGQGEITLEFALRKMWRRGDITSSAQYEVWQRLLNGIEDPLEWEQFQNEHGMDTIDLIRNTKSVSYDEQIYLKSSETVLFKNLTSYYDSKSKTWKPILGREKWHNKRVYMENSGIDLLTPTSASKRIIPSKLIEHTIFEGKNFDEKTKATVSELFTLDGEHYRLQVETASHGWDQISFASQLFQICQSELPEKYDGLKKKLNDILSAIKSQGGIAALNELSKDLEVEGKTSRDISIWLKNVREGILSTTPDVVLEEMLKASETGDIMYDFNLPQIVDKMSSYFLGGFTKANAPKQAGRSMILRSPDGFNIITDKEGNIVPELEYLKAKDKSKYSSRELNVHTFKDGKPSWGEIVCTRGWADKNGLKVGDNIPEELLKGLGVRIPTQSHHSIIFFKIVDFLPECMGDTVIAPKEIIPLSGADFDVDKLFTLLKSFYKQNGEIKIYGKGIVTPEARYEEYLNWYKNNDSYIKSRISEMIANNYTYNLEVEKISRKRVAIKEIFKKFDASNKTKTTSKQELKDRLNSLKEDRESLLEQFKDSPDFKVPETINNSIDSLYEAIKAVSALEQDVTKSQEITSSIRNMFYEEAFKEKSPIYTLEDFVKHLELKNPLALNNDLLDTMIELLNSPELAESYRTPATMEVIDKTGKDIFQRLKGKKYDSALGSSINGKLEAYTNNMDGKKLVGPHALSNVVGMFLEKNRVKLKKGKGLFLDGKLYNSFSRESEGYREDDVEINVEEILKGLVDPKDNKRWFKKYLDRRINDSSSSHTSAATDNAKNLGMKTLNHTMDTAGAWAMAIKLGMGQVRTNLLSSAPIMDELIKQFTNKHTYIEPTKTSMERIISNFINKYAEDNDVDLKSLSPLTTTEIIKSYVYTHLKKGVLSEAERSELAQINVKILHMFVRLKDVSNDARKIGDIISTNKKIEANFDTFNKIKESHHYLINGESMFEDIDKVINNDEALKTSLNTLYAALKLSPKFFISKSNIVTHYTEKILNSVSNANKSKMKPIISDLMSKRLIMKAIETVKGKETYDKFSELVLDGPNSIVAKFSRLIKEHPELKESNMLLNMLRVEKDKFGPDKLVTSTNINFNEFTQKMIDSFKALAESKNEDISNFAKDLVWYLIYKDNLDYKFFSYVKYISPETFYDIAQVTKQLSIGLYQNKELKDLIGVDYTQFEKEFYELLGRSGKYYRENVFNKVSYDSVSNTFRDENFTSNEDMDMNNGSYRNTTFNNFSKADEKGNKTQLIFTSFKNGVYTIKTLEGLKRKYVEDKGYIFPTETTEDGVNFIHSDILVLTNAKDGDNMVKAVLVRQNTESTPKDATSTYRLKKVFNNSFMSPISGSIEFYESFIDATFNDSPSKTTTFVDEDGSVSTYNELEEEQTIYDSPNSVGFNQNDDGSYENIPSGDEDVSTITDEYPSDLDGMEGDGIEIPEENLSTDSINLVSLSDEEIKQAEKYKKDCQ